MNYIIENQYFDIKQTFDCGQCFRWKENPDGSFTGIANKKKLTLTQNENQVTLIGISEDDISFWKNYFDMTTDYGEFIERFSDDETLKKAAECSYGIRILRQEPFETLISFIISQNNNIPRISGIIGRLCENFGEKLEGGGYSFPDPQALKGITENDLAPLRAGFRAKYICDAVLKVNGGEVCFEEIDALNLNEAREKLKHIKGVGDKVADCVLLFAFHKLGAFPKDVWVKRIMTEFYPEGLPECVKGAEGIAQQYLFHYVRNHGGLKEMSEKGKEEYVL